MRTSTSFKTGLAGLAAAVLGLATLPSAAQAATVTQAITIGATVASYGALSVAPTTLTFADADPGAVPSITATEGAVAVVARARVAPAASWTLALAGNAANLTEAGGGTIPMSAINWTATPVTGTGYNAGGALNGTTGVNVGTFTGPGTRSADLTFSLANSYDYAVGSYTGGATYTLTFP